METPSLFREILDPEDRKAWDEHVESSRTEYKFREIQLRIRARDGSIRWIEHACRPVTDEQGGFRGIRASNRDITERKDAELEVQLRREELAHVTRIVTVGELATSLAHEINQPLTAIRCNAEAAQRFLSGAAPDLGEVRQILTDIIQDDTRAGEVVRRIRTLVKKETPRREEVELNIAVWETIGLVRSASFLEGLSIMAELDPDLPVVQGDRVQLQQVVLNLLLNATAAMRDTSPASRRLVIRTAMEDGRAVRFSVRDSGTGIDRNDVDRLFEPFYTTKADGLGMGLSISRTIIKAHSGTIGAENNPEGGATFYFTLPVDRGTQS
jgi:C4-dicarboxylate-specific signal transduction histidine kinase